MTHFFRDEFARITVQFFNPDTFFVDLTLDVTVGRARNAQTYRTRCTVTRQTNDTDIMSQIFTAELCTEANPMSFFQHFFFKFYITEGTSVFVTRSGQLIIIMSRSQLHRQQVLLSRSTANDESDVVRRTSSCTQRLHFLNEERNQSAGIQDCFCFLIQVSLIGRTATFGHAKELIFHTFGSFDIYLRRQVTLRVHLVVHIQRSILRVTQVFFSICFVDTQRKSFFITIASPYLLSLFTMNDSRTGILTERKHAF